MYHDIKIEFTFIVFIFMIIMSSTVRCRGQGAAAGHGSSMRRTIYKKCPGHDDPGTGTSRGLTESGDGLEAGGGRGNGLVQAGR